MSKTFYDSHLEDNFEGEDKEQHTELQAIIDKQSLNVISVAFRV